jgi:hypothetical protein
MRVILGLDRERYSASKGTREAGPEPTPGAERLAVRTWAQSAGRRASRVPALVLSPVLVRAPIPVRTAGWARTKARRERPVRSVALRAVRAVARRGAAGPGAGQARTVAHRPARAAAAEPRAGPACAMALRAARARAVALRAAPAAAGALRGAPVQARAPASVQVSVRALAVAPAAPAPVRGVAPRLVGVLWRAAASTAGRCTRVASPLRVRRSAGVVGPRSAFRSFRPRRAARPLRPGRRPAPRARTGAGTTCRSRRRSARSPLVPTTPPCPQNAPRRLPRQPPAFPRRPLCRCRGAVRRRMGRPRCGTA